MTPTSFHSHGSVLVFLVALTLGALIGNLAVVALGGWRPRQPTSKERPRELLTTSLLALSAPAIGAFIAVAAVLAVALRSWWQPNFDHCNVATATPHLCFVHGSLHFASTWEALVVVALALVFAAAAASEARRQWRAHQRLRGMDVQRGDDGVWWTDDDEPYAFAAGVVRSRIVVSKGLSRALDVGQLQAAVEHERAHIRWRDAAVRVGARLVSALLWPSCRRQWMAMLVFAQERRADEAAAHAVGSRALVAETLLALARLQASAATTPNATTTPAMWTPALGDTALVARVEALCAAPPAPSTQHRWHWAAAVGAVVMLAVGHAAIHDVVEWVAQTLTSTTSPHHTHTHS